MVESGKGSVHSRPALWIKKTFWFESMPTPVTWLSLRPCGREGQLEISWYDGELVVEVFISLFLQLRIVNNERQRNILNDGILLVFLVKIQNLKVKKRVLHLYGIFGSIAKNAKKAKYAKECANLKI